MKNVKDELRMMKVEGWMMNDDNFKLLRGFDLWLMNKRTVICECRVAFTTENHFASKYSELQRQMVLLWMYCVSGVYDACYYYMIVYFMHI